MKIVFSGYGLSSKLAEIITEEKEMADYFEEAVYESLSSNVKKIIEKKYDRITTKSN